MKLKLKYGSGETELVLPDSRVVRVYRPREKKGVENLSHSLYSSLSHPIASPRLREIVEDGNTVVIVVDDLTRSVPTRRLLPPIITELNAGGVKLEDILVLVATGLHRKLSRQEEDKVLGRLRRKIKIFSHDPKRDLKLLGRTTLGTRVYLNRRFLEADIRVLLGDVEYHQFCGYGGGAKSVFPGLADAESIRLSHSRLDAPGAGAGRIEGNPIREEVEEVGRMAGVDFIVNVVLNSREEVVGIFSGNVKEAFRRGAKLCDAIYSLPVSRRADVVIASCGGYPKDINLYQAQKAIEGAIRLVKKGGKIILLAECREGTGSEVFSRWMKEAKTLDDISRRIKKKFIMGGHKAFELACEMRWADIYLLSSLSPRMVRDFFMHHLSRIDEIHRLLEKKDRVVVLPDAALTLAQLKSASRPPSFLSH